MSQEVQFFGCLSVNVSHCVKQLDWRLWRGSCRFYHAVRLVCKWWLFLSCDNNDKKNVCVVHCKACRKLFNPLNAKLNPICHLLALLGAHHILHISRISVKLLLKNGMATTAVSMLYKLTNLFRPFLLDSSLWLYVLNKQQVSCKYMNNENISTLNQSTL